MEKLTYLFSIVLFLLSSCSGSQNKIQQEEAPAEIATVTVEESVIPTPSTSYSYQVINKEVSSMTSGNDNYQKIRYTVEIPAEYNEVALNEIADVIKSQEPIPYVFVEFYMASQPKTGPNYGISKRTPDENNTQINYIAPPQEEPKTVDAPYKGCKVYGKWSMMGATVIAYQRGGRCYMVNYYGGSNYDEPERFIKTTYGGRTAFKNAEDPSDMYVINSNGDLDGYYQGDLASTFPRTN